jgi:glutamyl-tRNA reductase
LTAVPLGVPQDLEFHVVGLSHHTASVEERERLALDSAGCTQLLSQHHRADQPVLLLSTCNRLELYWGGSLDSHSWFEDLVRAKGANLPLTRLHGLDAVRHLFRVAAGLDSQILGETEILGQVRRAYEIARKLGTTSREMDLIFSSALSAGRRVRRDTMLGRHPGSVASAAVELASRYWRDISGREVLVLGAGEAAEGVLRSLQEHGAGAIVLLSRHPEKARALASAWGAEAGRLDELSDRLTSADLLLVATASARPVVLAAQLTRAMELRRSKELVIVDLAVPRNVEPAAREIQNLQLFDLDDLQRLSCPAAGEAIAKLEEAERVIEDELVRLGLSLRGRVVAPQLAELHRLGVELAEQESALALAQLESLSESQRDVVRQMADRLVRRVLYPVSRKLREQA